MNIDDDYVYSGSEEDVVAELSPADGPAEQTSKDLPVMAEESVERPAEQISAELPMIAEGSAEAAPTEKSKERTSKRARKDVSTGVESSLIGRHIHYSEVGFIDDKRACAHVLYALKHPDAPSNIPPLSELEESETYARYARSEMRSKALLNKVVLDYQRKLTDARQALKDADQLNELKANLDKQRDLVVRMAEKLQKQKDENRSLQASLSAKTEELEQSKGCYQKAFVELKALGGYSKEVKARADRLRNRLVYLDQVKTSAKRADQARSSMKCVQGLVKRKINIPPKIIEDMEKHAMKFEAEVNKFTPVELEEGDLTPLGEYVFVSEEFEELLSTEVPPEHDADELMPDADKGAPEVVGDPAPACPDEEGGGGCRAK